MVKRTIKYVDYDGLERTETFYFNLTKSELIKMEASVDGGLQNRLQKMTDSPKAPEIMKMMNQIILAAYGEKSDDGRRFMKSEELSKAFEETPAYDEIFMELVTDSKKALDFINSVIPNLAETEKGKVTPVS